MVLAIETNMRISLRVQSERDEDIANDCGRDAYNRRPSTVDLVQVSQMQKVEYTNKQLYRVRKQAIKDSDENIDDGPSSHACTMMRRHKLNSAGESFAALPLVPAKSPSTSYFTHYSCVPLFSRYYEDQQVLLENTETSSLLIQFCYLSNSVPNFLFIHPFQISSNKKSRRPD
jgi:hypothetical protein